jgi:hypothetical protein
MESTIDVLNRVWRDNAAEIQRLRDAGARDQEGYINGLDASNMRLRAAMASVARHSHPGDPPADPRAHVPTINKDDDPPTIDGEPLENDGTQASVRLGLGERK